MAVPEVKRYFTTPVAIMQDSCLLQWWRVHAGEYPTIARVVRDILSIPLTSVPVKRVFSAARDILPYQRNRMGDQMISALLVTISWDAISAKYGPCGQEGTPAHVKEGTTELGHDEVDNEKRGLRYDADILSRMGPFTTEEDNDGSHPSHSDSDGECDHRSAYSGKSMDGSQGLAVHPTPGLSQSLERTILNERLETPSPSTPRRRGKRLASEAVNLTPSMASRMNKRMRVRPGKAINYKV